jgi:hypothetical protein
MVFADKFSEELMGLSYLLEITVPAVVVGWTTTQSNRRDPCGAAVAFWGIAKTQKENEHGKKTQS